MAPEKMDITGAGPNPPCCSVLGVPLAVTDYREAAEWACRQAAASRQPVAIAAANTHVVALSRHDPEFGAALQRFDLLLPDGMPLIWCMNRQLSVPLRDRVYGPTFMMECLAASGATHSHFFLGGTEELLEQLKGKLVSRFPHLRVAGSFAPPFGRWPDAINQKIKDSIHQSGASFVWVGLGCPKQERWIADQKDRLPPGVYVAVGAAFSFHAGLVAQAPLWIQRRGLEWAFRLVTEPQRLWKRYLTYNTLFAWYLIKDSLFKRRS